MINALYSCDRPLRNVRYKIRFKLFIYLHSSLRVVETKEQFSFYY